jgi:hypothetical protein
MAVEFIKYQRLSEREFLTLPAAEKPLSHFKAIKYLNPLL